MFLRAGLVPRRGSLPTRARVVSADVVDKREHDGTIRIGLGVERASGFEIAVTSTLGAPAS
jgi:hypothetical protein